MGYRPSNNPFIELWFIVRLQFHDAVAVDHNRATGKVQSVVVPDMIPPRHTSGIAPTGLILSGPYANNSVFHFKSVPGPGLAYTKGQRTAAKATAMLVKGPLR